MEQALLHPQRSQSPGEDHQHCHQGRHAAVLGSKGTALERSLEEPSSPWAAGPMHMSGCESLQSRLAQ